MLRTIREAVLRNRAQEKPLRVAKDPSENFLIAASHFITDQPVGFDDIISHYTSFPNLKGYIRALRTTGVITPSAEDPTKFHFTPAGFQWAKETLGRLAIKPEQWAAAEAHYKKGAKEQFGPDREPEADREQEPSHDSTDVIDVSDIPTSKEPIFDEKDVTAPTPIAGVPTRPMRQPNSPQSDTAKGSDRDLGTGPTNVIPFPGRDLQKIIPSLSLDKILSPRQHHFDANLDSRDRSEIYKLVSPYQRP